jgi:hypothetical protein
MLPPLINPDGKYVFLLEQPKSTVCGFEKTVENITVTASQIGVSIQQLFEWLAESPEAKTLNSKLIREFLICSTCYTKVSPEECVLNKDKKFSCSMCASK